MFDRREGEREAESEREREREGSKGREQQGEHGAHGTEHPSFASPVVQSALRTGVASLRSSLEIPIGHVLVHIVACPQSSREINEPATYRQEHPGFVQVNRNRKAAVTARENRREKESWYNDSQTR